jgi:hypothetical protein
MERAVESGKVDGNPGALMQIGGQGRIVFLDERFAPFHDQWEFLSSIRSITRREVEEIVHLAAAKGEVVGVRLAPAEDEDEGTPWLTLPSRGRREVWVPGPAPGSL